MDSLGLGVVFFWCRALLLTLLFFFLAFGASSLFAQNVAVSGQVSDPSGAPIANAQITLRDSARQVEFHGTTNDTGSYSFAAVPRGNYTTVIEAGGFASYERASLIVDGLPSLST